MCCNNAFLSSTIQYGFDTVKHSILVYSLNEKIQDLWSNYVSSSAHKHTDEWIEKHREKSKMS